MSDGDAWLLLKKARIFPKQQLAIVRKTGHTLIQTSREWFRGGDREVPMTTIHLQEIGQVSAKPAKDFVVGDFAVWNRGYTSEILSISPKGRTQIAWVVRTKDGKVWDRVVKAERLVAFSDKHWR